MRARFYGNKLVADNARAFFVFLSLLSCKSVKSFLLIFPDIQQGNVSGKRL